jgi:hypothetical protein
VTHRRGRHRPSPGADRGDGGLLARADRGMDAGGGTAVHHELRARPSGYRKNSTSAGVTAWGLSRWVWPGRVR